MFIIVYLFGFFFRLGLAFGGLGGFEFVSFFICVESRDVWYWGV